MESIIDKINDLSQRYAINPLYRMRRDLDRIYIFPLNPFICPEMNRRIFVNPAEAIILSLLDGERNVGEVADEIAFLLDCERERAEDVAVNCLVKHAGILIEVSASNKDQVVRYAPNEFVIPRNNIDLASDQPKIPEVILFIPTFSCDLYCAYCYAPRDIKSDPALDFKNVESFLDKMLDWAMPALFLSGGEPFNYRYIRDLITACFKRNIKPIIPTKRPLDGETIDFLVEQKIDEMQFSIDTLDGNVSRKLIGRDQDYLAALVNTIKMLVGKGVRIYTNTVVTAYNIGTLPSLIEKMADLGVGQMNFSQYARSQYRHNDALFCDPDDLIAFDGLIKDLKDKYPRPRFNFKYIKDHSLMGRLEKGSFFKEMPVCTAGRMGMVILPDGSVTICENLYYQKDLLIGDLKKQSLEDIWYSRRRSEIINTGNAFLAAGACQTCAEAVNCYQNKGKCFVRALQAFGDIKMPDPYCPDSVGGTRIL